MECRPVTFPNLRARPYFSEVVKWRISPRTEMCQQRRRQEPRNEAERRSVKAAIRKTRRETEEGDFKMGEKKGWRLEETGKGGRVSYVSE